jgi:Flp pilus assembly protein TadD
MAPAPVSAEAAQEAELQYIEAHRFWQAGDYFDAVATMSEAVRLDPAKPKYHRVLGQWLAENPSCAEAAQEHYELAIALDPRDREAHEGLAKLLEQEGQGDKAKSLLERLASLEPAPSAGSRA